jgi:hypothetical protein
MSCLATEIAPLSNSEHLVLVRTIVVEPKYFFSDSDLNIYQFCPEWQHQIYVLYFLTSEKDFHRIHVYPGEIAKNRS